LWQVIPYQLRELTRWHDSTQWIATQIAALFIVSIQMRLCNELLFVTRGDYNKLVVDRKPRVVNQSYHLLMTQLHLIGQLFNRLRPSVVQVIPNISPELFVFFDVHRS